MARNDRDIPSAPNAAIVDEQTQRAAMGTSTPRRPQSPASRTTSPASVRRFEETGAGLPNPETKNLTVSATSPASSRRFEETGAGFPNPVVENAEVAVTETKVKPKLVSTYTDPETGDIIDVYDDETETIRKKGTLKADAKIAADALAAERLAERTSAYDILYSEFKDLGLESLVEEVKDSIIKSQSKSERILALRGSKAYQTRFGANADRVKNGFAAIDEATYLGLEDKYQSILQNYGMPEKYYKRGELGVQQYLADAIAKNIDPVTFEERIIEGQKVVNANKATFDAAKQFYPTLTDGDFLDYVLNPKNAVEDIKRKVTAAEIGGAQLSAGLQATASNAETLAKAGVTGKQYQAKATDIAESTLRGGQLAAIYGQGPYTQQMAEEVQLDTPGSVESLKKTKKVAGLERATFGGQTGLTSGALARDRAGGI